jgi:hypothetical protein
MLDLVDDHEATEPFQREEGVREPGEILVVLEVEVRDGIPPSGDHLPCERRLADLPGSEDPDDGVSAQESLERFEFAGTRDHDGDRTMKYR